MKIKRSTLDLWKKRIVFSFWMCIILSIPLIYFATSLFTVTTYQFVNVEDQYQSALRENLKKVILQKSLKIIPRDKILNYPGALMRKEIVSILPNTKSLTFVPVGLHTIKIKVTSYTPFLKIDDKYAITKDGVVYRELHNLDMLPTLVLSSSTKEVSVVDGILVTKLTQVNEKKLSDIYTLTQKVNSIVFNVSKIEIDAYGDIFLYDERNMSKVMFSGISDVDKVWSNILSAIDTDPLKSKLSKNKDTLEYLDARFGNKVFYKFTNDSGAAIIKNHATTTQVTSQSTGTLPQ